MLAYLLFTKKFEIGKIMLMKEFEKKLSEKVRHDTFLRSSANNNTLCG